MRSLVSPPPGPFNETLAQQGFTLFHGRAQCNVCHQTEHFTGPGLFTDITATPPSGGLADGIKVPGLKGISRTAPYFHDHSAATLEEAVTRFVVRGAPVPLLTLDEEAALVEYLRSL
jgi:cytochrome c peroxidase